MAKAIADHAFVVSEMPIILSMEMHCTPEQQAKIARDLITCLGDSLLSYDEFLAMGKTPSLSPLELSGRVLLKGKVQLGKQKSDNRYQQKVRGALQYVKSRSTITSSSRNTSRASNNKERDRSTRGEHDGQIERGTPESERASGDQISMQSSERAVDDDSHLLSRSSTTLLSRSFTTDLVFGDETAEKAASAMRRLQNTRGTNRKLQIAELYASVLSMRSTPVVKFLKYQYDAPPSILTISSIEEDKLLKVLGVSASERDLIEGLHSRQRTSVTDAVLGSTAAQVSRWALVRLASDPPAKVGHMQRRTTLALLRPYPMGIRFSGANMNPLAGWLAGAHCIALNMSNMDVPLQLHFALFSSSSGGFVLKPPEMRVITPIEEDGRTTIGQDGNHPDQLYLHWPPSRKRLFCATIRVLSLHTCPKRGERRPRLHGRRLACHRYHPELSGSPAPPNNADPSSPAVTLSIHPIGGFAAISRVLPLQQQLEIELSTHTVAGNGMNAQFDETFHCIASEPDTSFLRVGVTDGGQEVAYEIAVLGRLRSGYRAIQLRSVQHGTRIELAYLFVRIAPPSSVRNRSWVSSQQLRDMHNDVDEIPANDETEIHVLKDESLKLEEKVLVLEEKNSALKEENSRLQGRTRAHLAMEQQHPEENSRLQQENSSISRVQEGLWT